MGRDSNLPAALEPFARRAVFVAVVRSAMLTMPVAAVIVQILWLAGFRQALAIAAVIASGLVVSVIWAVRQRPAPADVARRVDDRARLQDLVITAAQSSGGSASPLVQLVRDDAVAALKRQSPRAMYPIELPRRWRHGAALLVVAQVALLALIWQPPAERAPQSSATALVLPSGNAASSAKEQQQDSRAPQQAENAAASTAATPVAATARPAASAIHESAEAAGSGAAGLERADRLRLAAASAESDLAAGRVPAARRAIVERYFAALQSRQSLQSQRKTPR